MLQELAALMCCICRHTGHNAMLPLSGSCRVGLMTARTCGSVDASESLCVEQGVTI